MASFKVKGEEDMYIKWVIGEVLSIRLDLADYATLMASGEDWCQSLLRAWRQGGVAAQYTAAESLSKHLIACRPTVTQAASHLVSLAAPALQLQCCLSNCGVKR